MSDFKEINTLKVYKNSEFAGILQRTASGCELILDSNFIDNPKIPYLSYCIPKTKSNIVVQGDNLPPFFAGLLPEGRRFNLLINKIKTSSDDLFSLLAAVGADCIGDVYIDNQLQKVPIAAPKFSEVNFHAYLEALLDSNNSSFDTKSLAGVQEKISASMISFPLNIARSNKDYILKLNPADKNNLIQNELCCLQLAQKCGFMVTKAKILCDKDHNFGLLVERFDRVNQKKIHQEDACQFLNRYPADKYRLTINQIADTLMQITTAPQLEILNLLLQYAFSYLICNGDLHAKNISLQTLKDGTITLTPLYDLICTAIYGDYRMALKIDGRDDNIKRGTLTAFAERYNISAKAVNSALDNLITRFKSHYQNVLIFEMTEKKQNLLTKMITKRLSDLQ